MTGGAIVTAGLVTPFTPFGPDAPVAPWLPVAPVAPGTPVAPVEPIGPAGPWGPVTFQLNEGTHHMIVIGADTHKRNHLVAVDGQTGAQAGQRAIAATDDGSLDALRFAAGLAEERVWAIEDCWHVSTRLEAALIAAGERVVRVPAAMTGQARKVSRQAGKSDPSDARAVAGTWSRSRPI